MTPLSWLYMLLVWGIILAVNVYCFYRILKKGGGSGPGA